MRCRVSPVTFGSSFFADYWASTSFQNSAAGLPLIVSSVLMERRISASRSGLKSQERSFQQTYALSSLQPASC